MKISDICSSNIVAADGAASLQRAAALMREHHVGMLLVTATGPAGTQAIGIVTDRDLVVDAMARGADAARTTLAEVADGDALAAIGVGASLDQAIAAMREHGVRRLVVAADGGGVYGILSMDDVLDALAHEMSELAHAARAGIERETRERPPLAPPAPLASVRMPGYSSAAYGAPSLS
ncbi:MAG TPA: CBS domain-containing protein [Burkholderiales bacterium]|nr:CBS domain-containing protein [Burkholderiales bacterium]